jgi:chromosomal replication initiation ATPase DnaA
MRAGAHGIREVEGGVMDPRNFKEEKAQFEKLAPRRFFLADLVRATALETKIPAPVLLGKRRFMKFVVPRWRIWWIGREDMGLTYSQIARLFGRDHTTIIHGCTRYDDIARTQDEVLRRTYLCQQAERIFKELGG